MSNAYLWRLAPSRHKLFEEFRVGYVLDHEQAPVSSEIKVALSDAIEVIIGTGATVAEGWPDGVDPVEEAESFGFHVGLLFAYHETKELERPQDLVEQQKRRLCTRSAWKTYFHDVDVFLCPANFTPAFPHDARPFEQRTIATPEGERPYDLQPFWIAHASLPGLPAVVAPVGTTSSGLPVGAQVIGPLYEDDTAMTFAELLMDMVGGYERPPV